MFRACLLTKPGKAGQFAAFKWTELGIFKTINLCIIPF